MKGKRKLARARKAGDREVAAHHEDIRHEGKARFIRALAEFLVSDQAVMSIKLSLQRPDALAWAKLRNAGPMLGWASIEEAEKALTRFLS